MTRLLADRSKEPVKTYLSALVARDRVRAGRVVLRLELHGDKTLDALREAPAPKLPEPPTHSWPRLIRLLLGSFEMARAPVLSWPGKTRARRRDT